MKKVIFDTDPGVDDAMALLFLQRQPEVDIVAVTTTFGNGGIETTTRNALYLCERFGIDATVGRGPAGPLVGPVPPPVSFVHGENGLGDIALDRAPSRQADPRPAHQVIIDLVEAHPGAISIVAVGRMTNLALALRQAPTIAGKVREVIVMGGAFGHHGNSGNVTPVAEANIYGDPLAADEVFGAAWPLTVVGLDVTQQTIMSTDYLRALADGAGEVGQFIWDITRFYEAFHRESGETRGIYVHDSSAVAYLVAPELYTTRRGPLRVSTEGLTVGQTIQKPAGKTVAVKDWDDRPDQTICTDVDAEKFLQSYRHRFCGGRS